MIESELIAIISSGETDTIEFKSDFPKNARDVAKEIAAFASSQGGRLILGVSDDGSVTGLSITSDEERKALRERIEGICASAIAPPIQVSVEHVTLDGNEVAVIHVPIGSEEIYYAASVPYVRVMSISRPATPQEVREKILLADVLSRLHELETARKNGADTAAAIMGQGELATKNFSDVEKWLHMRALRKFP